MSLDDDDTGGNKKHGKIKAALAIANTTVPGTHGVRYWHVAVGVILVVWVLIKI